LGNITAVNWLLERKAAINAKSASGDTALHYAVTTSFDGHRGHLSLTKLLLEKGAKPQEAAQQGETPITLAVLHQQQDLLAVLLNNADQAKLPSLHLAIMLKNQSLLKTLVKVRNQNLEVLDPEGRTPLYAAVAQGDLASATLLLIHGAKPDITSGADVLSLWHLAVQQQNLPMLELLAVTATSSIDLPNVKGDTALHLAVRSGRQELMFSLLDAGAYLKIRNYADKTPLKLAREIDPKLGVALIQKARLLKQEKQTNLQTLQETVQELEAELKELKGFLPGYNRDADKVAPSSKVDPQALSAFLKLVAEGEQDQAEAMLKKDRNLALVAGNVTDPGERTFNHITGFQYAVWALDWHMWRMIRKYLPDHAAAEQTKGIETGSWVQKHGEMASWQTLIDALQTYVDKLDQWDGGQRDHHWVKVIGGLQRRLPMHVIHEYCQPNRPFFPLPDFSKHEPPLVRKLSNGLKLIEFGDMYSIWRSNWSEALPYRATAWVKNRGRTTQEWIALASLFSHRTQQRGVLMAELNTKVKHTPGK